MFRLNKTNSLILWLSVVGDRVVVKKKEDMIVENFIKSIKAASDSLDVMDQLFSVDNKELMSSEAVTTALRQIFLFQKSDT